jgi:protein-tyrosine phosphatase
MSALVHNGRWALPNLYRCAALRTPPTQEDDEKLINFIADQLRIKSIVDLRSKAERRSARNSAVYDEFTKRNKLFFGDAIGESVVRDASLWVQFALVLCVALRMIKLAMLILVRFYLNVVGLRGLMVATVVHAAVPLRAVFLHCANAENAPVLVSCSQGKDRTGVVCALLQLLVGWTREQVVQDYLLSEQGLADVRESLVSREFQSVGLDPSFAHVSRDSIEALIDTVNKRFGGIENYFLNHLKLTADQVAQLRRNFGATAAKLSETHFI